MLVARRPVRRGASAGSGSARPTRRPRHRLVVRRPAGGRSPAARRARPGSGPRWSGRRARTPRAPGALRFDATVQPRAGARSSAGSAGSRSRPTVVAGRAARADALADRPDRRAGRGDQGARSARWLARAAPGGPGSSATTGRRYPAPTWSRPATRSSRPWWSATRSGPAGARCWSTSTTWPRWARRRSGCWTRSGARDASFAARVLAGLRRAGAAYGVPVLGGHTQLGVPAALSVTALGRAGAPGARRRRPARAPDPAHRRPRRRLAARLHRAGSGTRPRPGGPGRAAGHARRRSRAAGPPRPRTCRWPGSPARSACSPRPAAAGRCWTWPRCPARRGASLGDWLTCFPGFAMITAAGPGAAAAAGRARGQRGCGELVAGRGVRLRWPDGEADRGDRRAP